MDRERERKDREFVFGGPEQIWISSACQGASAYVILLILEKLCCVTAQEKRLERKGLQEPGDVPGRIPIPYPHREGSRVLVET